ncbi:BSD domain-containing protein [Cordyceps fumosorosea ARSEF 2679]|uniref:BSD domain-containing protein n=1 Tax=Cordyceps fumosorosea (strain ARSEF 2679) TaxID=1081104 RepID=A0A168BKU2_CORFA|nr:BSD domain-containing protein [Cordyceps fumosorosea ARSEF 2679]OAA70243.1 BSD domain-containing protein [Cordyceps fumosorosea ARSEF 2679]
MDLAYDHIQEEAFRRDTPKPAEQGSEQPQSSLNEEIQDAYKAFSSSPWGAKIGGFFGNMVKQGESVYNQASKELAEVSEDASKGFADLRETIISRTRGMSINASGDQAARSAAAGEEGTPTASGSAADSETYLSRLRTEAAKRLQDLQRAEDAADEALLRFGSNVRDFFRDAIQVAPPADGAEGSTLLFESKDASGKRVIHTSRFDAQLHVIHTSTSSFAKDPEGEEYNKFTSEFDVEKKTADIAADLEKYPELRETMEKLVPDQITYADFWKRYYFLRRGIEDAESRRKELLKAAAAEDEVGWDDDESDDEGAGASAAAPKKPASVESSTTINPKKDGLLKPGEVTRKSNDEKSQADSEASYDVVGGTSGLPSQAASSPKEAKKDDDSDDDWE